MTCLDLHIAQDGAGRKNHERVSKINEYLRGRGLVTWFDTDSVQGDVVDKVCGGIDDTELVLVCISQTYLDKVRDDGLDGRGGRGVGSGRRVLAACMGGCWWHAWGGCWWHTYSLNSVTGWGTNCSKTRASREDEREARRPHRPGR